MVRSSCHAGGLQLSNLEYARLGEIIGGYDLGMSIYLGAHQVVQSNLVLKRTYIT